MSIQNYPFTILRGRARPMLWVRIYNPSDMKHTRPLLAKVDTGADACLFPLAIAEELGFDLKSTKPFDVRSSTGTGQAYPQRAMIDILGVGDDGSVGTKVLHRIPRITVYFVKDGGEFLLGVEDFLETAVVTIDYPAKAFSIEFPG